VIVSNLKFDASAITKEANLGVRNPEFNGIQVSLGYRWF
jgi:hypothetical protein